MEKLKRYEDALYAISNFSHHGTGEEAAKIARKALNLYAT